MNTDLVILIVSPPGDLQIGLQALLTTHLDIYVLVVGEANSALKIIEKNDPAIVILDQDISGDSVVQLIEDIKINWPQVICIALVNDDQSRQEVNSVSVDLILIKGLPGAKLIMEIQSLLNRKETENQEKSSE